MDWRDQGRAEPSEVRRIDPEHPDAPAGRATEGDLFEDEHDGWQPVRRRSSAPPGE